MSFSVDITEFCKKTKIRSELVCKKIALDVFKGVVENTPVKTGLAKGNWFPSFGSPSTETTTGTADSTTRAEQGVLSWDVKGSIFLTNNLPYIQKLEHGSSQQAPSGMVRITLARFQGIVTEASK